MESKDYKLQTYKKIKNDYLQFSKLSKIYNINNMNNVNELHNMNKCSRTDKQIYNDTWKETRYTLDEQVIMPKIKRQIAFKLQD